MTDREGLFRSVKRLVVKVGTNFIIGKDASEKKTWLLNFVNDIVALREMGKEVVIVSSGAIGAGMHLLGIKKRPQLVPLQQACAAVGQNQLMQIYERLFRRHKIMVGQVLITSNGLSERKRYFNLRNTMNALLELGVVPIINENDSVAVEEIKFGDNDTLSAHVTNTVEADLLIIMTDIDGLYAGDPKHTPLAELISEITKITPKIKSYCGTKGTETSIGGMTTKLSAAEIVMRSGEMMLIVNGLTERLPEIIKGKNVGTLFLPGEKRLSSHKRWIAFSRKTIGTLFVDAGGVAALVEKNKSLLPVGIKKISGTFKKGDIVAIFTEQGKKIARGITNYSSEEIEKIKGQRSKQIQSILGRRDYEEVVHKNNLVLS
jgi:glutamate 5-kinase